MELSTEASFCRHFPVWPQKENSDHLLHWVVNAEEINFRWQNFPSDWIAFECQLFSPIVYLFTLLFSISKPNYKISIRKGRKENLYTNKEVRKLMSILTLNQWMLLKHQISSTHVHMDEASSKYASASCICFCHHQHLPLFQVIDMHYPLLNL
jgi:hypothetical protein